MTNGNQLIYTVRQILGDEHPNGFFLPINYQNKIIEVPNYIFKDSKAQYPEIRITPLVTDNQVSHQHKNCHNNNITKYYEAIFQIDIYAKNIPQVNTIYEELTNRIDLFTNPDTIVYGFDNNFKPINNNPKIFKNDIYSSEYFKLSTIYLNNHILKKARAINYMQPNTWYLDENGLYIYPIHKSDLKTIQIISYINGLLFQNGDSLALRDIMRLSTFDKKMLSELEDNQVERISFTLRILYLKTNERQCGPKLEQTIISAKNNQ